VCPASSDDVADQRWHAVSRVRCAAVIAPLSVADFMLRYGPCALVTGGANGIGAEYCRQLAAMGMNLIILDRDETALEEIARELGGSDGVTTVAMDLAWPADRLLVELREATRGREVGLLVANAAWSPVGPFVESELDSLLTALDINSRATVVFAHELGRAMATRGRGGIVIMSSLAAETGAAQVALYSATKAFNLVLAEGLWYELRDRGVDVIAIRPGSTRTLSWQKTQPADGDVSDAMEPAAVVADALAMLGTTPSTPSGDANRQAERYFRSLSRREVIELMSAITSKLVPPEPPP
jgi:short-subunit dehydrogenase